MKQCIRLNFRRFLFDSVEKKVHCNIAYTLDAVLETRLRAILISSCTQLIQRHILEGKTDE